MQQHINELQQDNENLKAQINFEQARFKDLESVVENERRGMHENDLRISDLERQNKDLKTEADRQKLRVESKYCYPPNPLLTFFYPKLGLQQHIDNYQKYASNRGEVSPGTSSAAGDNALTQQLKQENERLKEYVTQYEDQIKRLESDLQDLK